MPDPIHKSLSNIQDALTTTHWAESEDGTVRAEATARHQTSLHLTPAALRHPPETLATLILTTQREAQQKAEAAVSTHLNTYREDPRVTTALESLQTTQANPTPPPPQTPTRQRREEDEETYVNSVYNSNEAW